MPITPLRIALLGFGTVGRALHALLHRQHEALARDHQIEYRITGIASRRLGWRANLDGLDVATDSERAGGDCADVHDWLQSSAPDVVFEAIALDPTSGQPALDYLRAALDRGTHVISANKGPVVHGYRELSALAAARGVQYRFESAVMDGAPVFSLMRECLPLAGLRAVRGVFTSTATVVLQAIEAGLSLHEGIARAQALGIAEADASYDVDGWESAMKLCALANVLFGAELRPTDVARCGIRDLTSSEIRDAAAAGTPYRLMGHLGRDAAGAVHARVAPARCTADGPLGIVHGATLVMHYEAEMFPGGLTVTSHNPDPTTTAYGMLTDFVALYRN